MRRFSKAITVTLLTVFTMIMLCINTYAESNQQIKIYQQSKQKSLLIGTQKNEQWATKEVDRIKIFTETIKENRKAKTDSVGIGWKSDVKIDRVSIYHEGDRLEEPIFSYKVIYNYIYLEDIIMYSQGSLAGKKIEISFEADNHEEVFAIEDIVLPEKNVADNAKTEKENCKSVKVNPVEMKSPGFANPIEVEPKPQD